MRPLHSSLCSLGRKQGLAEGAKELGALVSRLQRRVASFRHLEEEAAYERLHADPEGVVHRHRRQAVTAAQRLVHPIHLRAMRAMEIVLTPGAPGALAKTTKDLRSGEADNAEHRAAQDHEAEPERLVRRWLH